MSFNEVAEQGAMNEREKFDLAEECRALRAEVKQAAFLRKTWQATLDTSEHRAKQAEAKLAEVVGALKPTARVLLDWIHKVHRETGCTCQERGSLPCDAQCLALRVEKVLALAKIRHANEGYDAALREVMRMLNGEKP